MIQPALQVVMQVPQLFYKQKNPQQATTQTYTTQYCGYHTCNPTQSTRDLATSLLHLSQYSSPSLQDQIHHTPYPRDQETAAVQCCTGPLHSGTSVAGVGSCGNYSRQGSAPLRGHSRQP